MHVIVRQPTPKNRDRIMPADKRRISFTDGDTIELTFKYDNCSRKKQPSGKGYFWIFTCDEGSLAASKSLTSTIREYWPGRQGSLTITRHSDRNYEIVDGVKSDYAEHELKQAEYDTSQGGYVEIPWGADIAAKDPNSDKPSAPAEAPTENEGPTDREIKPRYLWTDYESMLIAAQDMATRVLGAGTGTGQEKATYLDVRWKMTYSLMGWAFRDRMSVSSIAADLTTEPQDDSEEADSPGEEKPQSAEVDSDDLPF
jgi:hypothetical protein